MTIKETGFRPFYHKICALELNEKLMLLHGALADRPCVTISWFRPDEKKLGYTRLIDGLLASFHQLYEKGMRDRTIRTDLPERMMFSALFHIMLATVTRYSVGLFYVSGGGTNPEEELLMLRNMLYAQMVRV